MGKYAEESGCSSVLCCRFLNWILKVSVKHAAVSHRTLDLVYVVLGLLQQRQTLSK
jgi:hypothetical protein